MNYLGHWLFSEPTPDALVGSLWPDFARRPSPESVTERFLIHFDRHQWLDKVTDTTPLLETLRTRLRPKLRKTTPVVVDMLIDHHLAKHWQRYHSEPLMEFSEYRYQQVQRFNGLQLPERMEKMLYWMTKDDWLTGYRDQKNVSRALSSMSRRIRFADTMELHAYWAIQQLEDQEMAVDSFIKSILARLSEQKG